MNLTLSIISLLVFTVFIIYQRLKTKRYLLQVRLKSAYTKMETYAMTEMKELNDDQILYLKTMKNISVNPSFLDMRLLITSNRNEKVKKDFKYDKKFFRETKKSFGKEFKPLIEEFDHNTTGLLVMSTYTLRFFVFFLKLVIPLAFNKYVLQLIFEKGLLIVKRKIKTEFSFLISNESALIHSTLKNYVPGNKVEAGLGY